MTEHTTQLYDLPIQTTGVTYTPVTPDLQQQVINGINALQPIETAATLERWESVYIIEGVTYSVSGLHRELADVVHVILYS